MTHIYNADIEQAHIYNADIELENELAEQYDEVQPEYDTTVEDYESDYYARVSPDGTPFEGN